jgi:hypothetical protein
MGKYLYFRSDSFKSNRDFATWLHQELCDAGEAAGTPIDQEYMFVIPINWDGNQVEIYLGRNDEECSPPLWQVWSEQKVSIFRRLFSKPDSGVEQHFQSLLVTLVSKLDGASNIEWSDI